MTEPDEQRPLVLSRNHGRTAESDACKADGPGVADLIEAGFLRQERDPGTVGWVGGNQGEADRRLLRLLDRFDLTVQVLPAAGTSIALTTCRLPVGDGEEAVSFVGKGFGSDDAIRRCLGEVAEFWSWLYDPRQDRPKIALDPGAPRLPGIADALDCREGWSRRDEAAIQAPGWCSVTRLNAEGSIWCPAPLCFGRYVSPDRAAPDAGLDNSGCAAGPSWDDALKGGLLEAIERDATGLWWQRGLARPRRDPRGIASPRLVRGLIVHGEESGRQCWFLDLTTDIAIPVVAAISVEDDGTLPALGVTCRPRIADAMEGAFLEMVQSELALAALLQRLDECAPSVADAELAAWYDNADIDRMPWLAPHGNAQPEAFSRDGASSILDRLTACGLKAYAMDLTRSSLGIPVAKVICPGLAHFRRPQGAGRLMRVPEQLGWYSLLANNGAFNAVPLLI